MKNNSLKNLFMFSIISYVILVVIIFNIIKQMSYSYTFENLEDTLRNVKALRTFVSLEQKEEVYRLQNNNIVSKEYFKPELLSSTYCSKTVNNIYNDIRLDKKLDPVLIRFASNNPRNIKNKANQFESNILEKFNNKEISQYKEIKYNEDGKKVLYYAIPTKPLTQKCMKCHSTPNKAPKELIDTYGDKNGFYEKIGIIRALLSTEYPLDDSDKFIYKSTAVLSFVLLVIFIFFIYLYTHFTNKIIKKNLKLKELNDSLEEKIQHETHALQTTNTQLQNVIKGSELGYWDWNLKTGWHEVNQRWLDILGLDEKDIKHNQSDWESRILEEDQKRIMPIINKAIEDNKTYTVEFRMRHKDGHHVWIEGSGSLIEKYNNGDALRACGTHKDISKRKEEEFKLIKAKEELKKLSITDKLTTLYNRHKLDEVLQDEQNRSNRYKTNFGVLIFDIDYFKKVNDTFGHNVGDQVLIKFANILKVNSRQTDIVGRWGGEEFIIIVPLVDKDSILKFANNLKDKIENNVFDVVGKITASIGVSIYKNNESTKEIISRADEALYFSKNNGRNKISFK